MADEQQPVPAVIPQGIPVQSHPKQQAPLLKMMGKMLHLKTPKGGIHTNSSVKISHGHRGKDRRNNPRFY
jgi:hypothetical protein